MTKKSRLNLNKETLVRLNDKDLARAGGGRDTSPPPVWIGDTKVVCMSWSCV